MITYGNHSIDPATLPEASVNALLTKGLAHFLGNEQASKITARIVSELKLEDSVVGDVRKAAITAYRAANPKHVSDWTAEVVKEALGKLSAGTVGVSTRGPTGTKLDTVVRALAKAEVVSILSAMSPSVKFPKGEEKVAFPDGNAFTGDELIARRLAKHGERLTKEGEKKMADDARKAAKAAEGAKASGLTGIDALDA